MGRKKGGGHPAGGRSGSKQAPALWAAGAAVTVAAAAYFGLLGRAAPNAQRGLQDGAAAGLGPQEERDFEQLDMVREALFGSMHSQYAFDDASKEWTFKPGEKGFASAEYWEERYKSTDRQYDWYGSWMGTISGVPGSSLKELVMPSLPGPDIAVLNLGCGNSRLAEQMYEDGIRNITNVDISIAAVEKMSARNAHLDPPMVYLQMDITSLGFQNESFDLVFDKGTLDALYTGSTASIPLAVDEAWRVLRPGGHFVSVTFGRPYTRWHLFKPPSAPGWVSRSTRVIARSSDKPGEVLTLSTNEDPRGNQHANAIYVYLMRKGRPGEEVPPLTPTETGEVPRSKR